MKVINTASLSAVLFKIKKNRLSASDIAAVEKFSRTFKPKRLVRLKPFFDEEEE